MIYSITTLQSDYKNYYSDISLDAASVFSSRFFPKFTNDIPHGQQHEDDDISILSCIEQDFDLDAIHNTEESLKTSKACPSSITRRYSNIKQSNDCSPQPEITHDKCDIQSSSSMCMKNEQIHINPDIQNQCDNTIEIVYDCEEDIYHDCLNQSTHSKAFHLSIDYQYLANNIKESQCKVQCIRSHEVDDMLHAVDLVELIGEHEPFNTLACAVTTSQKLQKFELL